MCKSQSRIGVDYVLTDLKSGNGTIMDFRCNGPFYHLYILHQKLQKLLMLFLISYVRMWLISVQNGQLCE